MNLKSLNGMTWLGTLLVLLGTFLVIPHIHFNQQSNFVTNHLQIFLWSLVLICSGLAIIHSYNDGRRLKAIIMSIIFTVIGLSMVYVMERLLIYQAIKEQELEITIKASALKSHIESNIMGDIYLSYSIISYLRSNNFEFDDQEFERLANNIIETSPRIRHLAIAKDLTITHVFPLAGNERAIGLNYRNSPQQLPMVLKAIEENKTILSGPVSLVQGGEAVIGRIPIFRSTDDSTSQQLWGIMSIVIDINAMFQQVRELQSESHITILGKDAMGLKGDIVYGEPDTLMKDPLYYRIALPYGEWQMAVAPVSGWINESPYKYSNRLALFFIWFLMIIFTLIRADHQKREQKSIDSLQTKLRDTERLSSIREKESEHKVQAQKLEAIGQLTGGIAHDFNNILTAINGYAELTQMSLKSGVNEEKLNANLKEIIKAGNRAKALVGQMMTFSRGKDIKAVVIEPMVVLQETLQMMHAMLPTTISLTTDYQDYDSRVKIDPVQLQQVLINLVVNARDAMPKQQGQITIKTKLQEAYLGDCVSCNQTFNGNYLSISVSDNGQGITKQDLSKIFDPFYTTKAVGKGSGMGLSVVHGIMHGVNGHIRVESRLNQGTTIELLFETTDEKPLKQISPKPQSEQLKRQSVITKKILVIDDEEAITQLYEDLFEAEGITAMVFNRPEIALDYYKNNVRDIALVVTDYTMPGMNGVDLVKAIRKINARVPVILCSGNADVSDRDVFRAIGVDHFLSKPVDLKKISKIVSNYL